MVKHVVGLAIEPHFYQPHPDGWSIYKLVVTCIHSACCPINTGTRPQRAKWLCAHDLFTQRLAEQDFKIATLAK